MSGPDMRARKKLNEAGYFLDALKRTRHLAFEYNLSAFVTAWRSVLDLMLFDFAEKYSLGFGREDRVTAEAFSNAAKDAKCERALSFLNWWNDQVSQLRKNPLFTKRDMIVHRDYPEMNLTIPLPMSWSPWIETLKRDDDTLDVKILEKPNGKKELFVGRLGMISDISELTFENNGEIVKTELCFKDFPRQSVEEVCLRALEYMARIVETAEKKYWV